MCRNWGCDMDDVDRFLSTAFMKTETVEQEQVFQEIFLLMELKYLEMVHILH